MPTETAQRPGYRPQNAGFGPARVVPVLRAMCELTSWCRTIPSASGRLSKRRADDSANLGEILASFAAKDVIDDACNLQGVGLTCVCKIQKSFHDLGIKMRP